MRFTRQGLTDDDQFLYATHKQTNKMREIVHLQAGQCGNQIGAKVCSQFLSSAALYLFQLIKYIF